MTYQHKQGHDPTQRGFACANNVAEMIIFKLFKFAELSVMAQGYCSATVSELEH